MKEPPVISSINFISSNITYILEQCQFLYLVLPAITVALCSSAFANLLSVATPAAPIQSSNPKTLEAQQPQAKSYTAYEKQDSPEQLAEAVIISNHKINHLSTKLFCPDAIFFSL